MSIKIENLNYIYSPDTPFQVYALKEINLKIEEGTFTVIIGQTGSGKSTLIQHLNGLVIPTSGKVYVNGLETSTKQNRKLIRQQVGIVFQYPEHQLFEETVYKDIAFGPHNMGLGAGEVEERVRMALQLVDLPEEILDKSPFDLSGGQMRRVAIAGVLAMAPRILVLDEPTAGLDPMSRKSIMQMIDKLQEQQQITIFLVTHNMEEAAHFADRILVMHEGQIVLDGCPKEIFRHITELRRIGLDVPQVTELCYLLSERGWHIPDVVLTIEDAGVILAKLLGVNTNAN